MLHCTVKKEFQSFMMLSLEKHWQQRVRHITAKLLQLCWHYGIPSVHKTNLLKVHKIMVATGLAGSCWGPPGFVRALLFTVLQVRYRQGRDSYGIHDSISYPPEARPMLLLAGAASSRVWCITRWARQLLVGSGQVTGGEAFLGVERWFLLLFFQSMPWFGLFWCHRALLTITFTITYASFCAKTFTWLVSFSGFLLSSAIDADSLFRRRVSIYGGALRVGIEQQ